MVLVIVLIALLTLVLLVVTSPLHRSGGETEALVTVFHITTD